MSKFYTNYSTIGNSLYIRGYDDGKYFSEKINIKPTLYLDDITGQSEIKSIYDKPIKSVEMENIWAAKEFVDSYSGTNVNVYGNTNHGSQYLIENPELAKYNSKDIKIMFFDIEVYSDNIGGKFPESHEALCPIVSISFYDSKSKKYVVLGYPRYPGKDDTQVWAKHRSSIPKNIEGGQDVLDNLSYIECQNEEDLINKFIVALNTFKPDILSGWNSGKFDVVYMYTRMKNLGMDPARLSPWKKARIRAYRGKFDMEYSVTLDGISNIDYMDLYIKRNETLPTYKLDYVAKKEKVGAKISYRGSLNELYETDYQKFIDYNIVDTVILKKIEEKRNLFDSIYGIAYRTKSTFEDAFGTVKVWENIIADELWKINKRPPARRPPKYEGESIPGGYVKVPQPKRYGWSESFDYNSLYPKLCEMFNISPETLVPEHEIMTSPDLMLHKKTDVSFLKPNETLCASGYVFRTDFEGIIPKIMRELYQERVVMKKKMLEAKQRAANGDVSAKEEAIYYNTQQTAAKLLLNSGYGALAQSSFLYFDNRLASSITLSGQLAIKWAEKSMNEYFNKILKTENQDYCIGIDTDSLYMNIDPLVKKFCSNMNTDQRVDAMDKFAAEKIEPMLASTLEELKVYTNARSQQMFAKRENISSASIWTAKKRYCMLVHDSEGVRYESPELKITGLEAIKSSTPDFARDKMKELLMLILESENNEEKCQEFIKLVKDEFMTMENVEAIAFPRSMNGMSEYKDINSPSWSKKGCGAAPHGAIVYNELIERMNLVNYRPIKEGTKAFYVYLKKPNRANNTHVLSFESEIPKEFGIHPAIDRKKQYEKSFLSPMKELMQLSGWEIEKKSNLNSLFM